jgi:hypothetical protein
MQLLFHFLFFCIKSYTISISNKEGGNYTLIYLTVNLQGHFHTCVFHMASHMWLSCDLRLCCIGQTVNHVREACVLLLPFLHQCYWLVRKFRSKTLSHTLTKLEIRHNLMAHGKSTRWKGRRGVTVTIWWFHFKFQQFEVFCAKNLYISFVFTLCISAVFVL